VYLPTSIEVLTLEGERVKEVRVRVALADSVLRLADGAGVTFVVREMEGRG
jgi:hypothetical protein